MDLFSNLQMGLEVRKNLGFLISSEVEGLTNDVFAKRPLYWSFMQEIKRDATF